MFVLFGVVCLLSCILATSVSVFWCCVSFCLLVFNLFVKFFCLSFIVDFVGFGLGVGLGVLLCLRVLRLFWVGVFGFVLVFMLFC